MTHFGNLPGYPASHGCVRLPLDFARRLYQVTSTGSTVIISDQVQDEGTTATFGLLFSAAAEPLDSSKASTWKPDDAPAGPLSMLISSADEAIYVYRNGIEIGRTPIIGLGGWKGWYVYSTISELNAEGSRDWLAVTGTAGKAPAIWDLMNEIVVDQQFIARIRPLIEPGSTLVLTDAPVTVSTRSEAGFSILTTGAALPQ